MKIRAGTISFSKNKAKSIYCREMEIWRQLNVLDDISCNNFHSYEIDLVLKEFNKVKTEIQSLYDKKGLAAIFRSKCRWIETGERPTKYFFNLEKRNYMKKIITELRMEDETIAKNETLIGLDAIENYFNKTFICQQTAQHRIITMNIFRICLSPGFLMKSEIIWKVF